MLEDDAAGIGSSVLHLDTRIDAGPVAAKERVSVGPSDSFFDLRWRNALLGIDLAVRAARTLAEGGTLAAAPQEAAAAKMYPTPGSAELRRLERLTVGFSRLPEGTTPSS